MKTSILFNLSVVLRCHMQNRTCTTPNPQIPTHTKVKRSPTSLGLDDISVGEVKDAVRKHSFVKF